MTISIRARHRIIRSISLLVMALHPRYEHYPWSPDCFSRQPLQSCLFLTIKMLDSFIFLEIKHYLTNNCSFPQLSWTRFLLSLSAVLGTRWEVQTSVDQTRPYSRLPNTGHCSPSRAGPLCTFTWTWTYTWTWTRCWYARKGLSWSRFGDKTTTGEIQLWLCFSQL